MNPNMLAEMAKLSQLGNQHPHVPIIGQPIKLTETGGQVLQLTVFKLEDTAQPFDIFVQAGDDMVRPLLGEEPDEAKRFEWIATSEANQRIAMTFWAMRAIACLVTAIQGGSDPAFNLGNKTYRQKIRELQPPLQKTERTTPETLAQARENFENANPGVDLRQVAANYHKDQLDEMKHNIESHTSQDRKNPPTKAPGKFKPRNSKVLDEIIIPPTGGM